MTPLMVAARKGNRELVRRLVEAGAHDGQLAADVLGWCQQQRPELFERIDYFILEPSARRRSMWPFTSVAIPALS